MSQIDEVLSVIDNVRVGLGLFPLGPAAAPINEALKLISDLLKETQDIEAALEALRARGYRDAQNEINKLYKAP